MGSRYLCVVVGAMTALGIACAAAPVAAVETPEAHLRGAASHSPARALAALDTVGQWRMLSARPAPPQILGPVAAYDSRRGRMLVVGGVPDAGPVIVHALDLGPEPQWSVVPAAGTPPIVSGPVLIYDPIRDRLLMFGAGGFGDVWALTLSGAPTWQLLPTTGNRPAGRTFAAAVYDPILDRVIVLGGAVGGTYTSDTFVLSLATNQWAVLPVYSRPPDGRIRAGVIDDPVGNRLILFGGENSTGPLNDLWELSLTSRPEWTQVLLEAPAPTPRAELAAVYDPVRRAMVIWSGFGVGSYQQDLWSLSLATRSWTELQPAGAPDPRTQGSAIYDPAGDRLVIYGGANNLGWLDQCASISLADPSHWTPFLPPAPPTAPGPRQLSALALDSRRARVVALGGDFRPSDVGAWIFSADDSAAWTPWTPAYMTRLPFVGTAMYDSLADRVVMFLGYATWALGLGAEPVWEQIDKGAPAGPDASAMLDPVRRRIIVFGGTGYIPKGDSFTQPDVWALDLDGGTWTRLGVGPMPQGSAGHSAVYDPVGDRMIVVGGYWLYGMGRRVSWVNRIWATPLEGPLSWTAFTTTGPVPPDGSALYDRNRDRLLLFAEDGSVWSRTARNSGEWAQLDTGVLSPPGTGSMVFDPVRDQVLRLFVADGDSVESWALTFRPPDIVLVSAIAAFDAVEIRWRSPDARGREATVERRGEQSDWTVIGALTFDENGTAMVRDPNVSPGARYAYRLTGPQGGGAWSTDSTWVMIPILPTSALRAWPNPAARTFRVAFWLPDASPARLEVFDVSGRRVLSRAVGGLGAGTHVIAVAEEEALVPGVYLVRLDRAGQRLETRAVVIR